MLKLKVLEERKRKDHALHARRRRGQKHCTVVSYYLNFNCIPNSDATNWGADKIMLELKLDIQMSILTPANDNFMCEIIIILIIKS